MLREYAKLASLCQSERADYQTFLLRLCEREVHDRELRAGDRLTHRIHILEANGESYRLRESKDRLKRRRTTRKRK